MKKKEAKKYKEEYFDHWLAMYNLNQDDFTNESIEQQIEMYKSIEGDEEYEELKKELSQILQNKNLRMFLSKAKKGTRVTDLELMAKSILAH